MSRRSSAFALAVTFVALGACSSRGGPVAQPSPTGPPAVDYTFVRQHAEQFDVDVPNRPPGSQHELAAATYILSHLQFAGYAPVLDAVPVANQVQSTNVVALPPSAEEPEIVVAIGYDDDGRGAGEGAQIGLFLELARALNVAAPDHRVAFVALGAEGADNAGSGKLARTLRNYDIRPQLLLLGGHSPAPFASGACASESHGLLAADVDECGSGFAFRWLEDVVAGQTFIEGSGQQVGDPLLRLLLSTADRVDAVTYLDEILVSTRARVAEARAKVSDDVLEQRIASQDAPRGFRAALQRAHRPALIAEIKRRSPSRGPLDLDLDAQALARRYADGGAAAISVLTAPDHFSGSLEDLEAARAAGLPVLRKDFIVDAFQVFEARAAGADAVLLIVRITDDLAGLVKTCTSLGMDALVEVYDESDLGSALAGGADLIGINHRDLTSFEVDPERTAKLRPSIPPGPLVVSLSGVFTRDDVVRMADAGADAVLVGESLVMAHDPAAHLRSLTGA